MNWKPITAAWVIAVVLASAGAGRAQTLPAVKNLRCEYQAEGPRSKAGRFITGRCALRTTTRI